MEEAVEPVLSSALDMLHNDAKQDSYRNDPVKWAWDVLGVYLWSKQVEVSDSVRSHKRTVVAAAHSVAKSHTAGILACWWVATRPRGEAIVVTTAPTHKQVSAILWEEIRKNHRLAASRGFPMPGRVTGADEWKLDDGTLVGMGRKPADGDSHAFQGIHRPYVLAILDEACGIDEELWTGVEAITTTANSRILAIGNPDDRNTEFGDVFEDAKHEALWNRIRIPASSSPNFTGEKVPDPLPDVLVQRSWVEDRKAAWGEDDARYQSKVNALFPKSNAMGLFNEPLLAQAFIDDDEDVPAEGTLVLGVDVARFGDDKSVVAARRGRRVWITDAWHGMDTVTTAEQVMAIAYELARKDERGNVVETVDIRVDAIGVGAGVVDTLSAKWAQEHMLRGKCYFTVHEMNGSARVPHHMGGSVGGYGNARAWWHDQLKHQMRNKRVRLEEHEQLRHELRQIRMRYSSGKMYIISKEEMRKAGQKSPDYSDAVVYACAPVVDVQEGITGMESAEQATERMRKEALLEQMSMEEHMQISPY